MPLIGASLVNSENFLRGVALSVKTPWGLSKRKSDASSGHPPGRRKWAGLLRLADCVTAAPSIGGADFQQPYRINDAGPRNREEKHVRPERCGPLNNAADEFCDQVQCTESFLLLEDGVKRRKPAPSRLPCTGTGLSAS